MLKDERLVFVKATDIQGAVVFINVQEIEVIEACGLTQSLIRTRSGNQTRVVMQPERLVELVSKAGHAAYT